MAIGKSSNYQFETSWGTLRETLSPNGTSWQYPPPGPYPAGYGGSGGGGVSTAYMQPFYQKGVVPNSWYNRVNVTGASQGDVNSWLKADLSMGYTNSSNEQAYKGDNGPLLGLLVWPSTDNASDYLSITGARRRLDRSGGGGPGVRWHRRLPATGRTHRNAGGGVLRRPARLRADALLRPRGYAPAPPLHLEIHTMTRIGNASSSCTGRRSTRSPARSRSAG